VVEEKAVRLESGRFKRVGRPPIRRPRPAVGKSVAVIAAALLGGLVLAPGTAEAGQHGSSLKGGSAHPEGKQGKKARPGSGSLGSQQRDEVPEETRMLPRAQQFKKDGFLVWENTTAAEFDDMFPDLTDVNRAPSGDPNCLSCAVAAARTMAGDPTQAGSLPETGKARERLVNRLALLEWTKASDLSDLMVHVRHADEGTQYIVVATWSGEKEGHAYNMVKRRGAAALVDAQRRTFGALGQPPGTTYRYAPVDNKTLFLLSA
jgi:hypothetical protein